MLSLREFIELLINQIISEFEITKSDLFSSKSDIAVDARIMLVGLLVRDGWSEKEICKATGWLQPRVNWLKNHFDDRMKRRSFRETYEMIKKDK